MTRPSDDWPYRQATEEEAREQARRSVERAEEIARLVRQREAKLRAALDWRTT